MNVSSKITQKVACLLVLTAALTASAEFAGGGFVRAASASKASPMGMSAVIEHTLVSASKSVITK